MKCHYEEGGSHDVISYWSAEVEVREVFDDAGWNVGNTGDYTLYNDTDDPYHRGEASGITRW